MLRKNQKKVLVFIANNRGVSKWDILKGLKLDYYDYGTIRHTVNSLKKEKFIYFTHEYSVKNIKKEVYYVTKLGLLYAKKHELGVKG